MAKEMSVKDRENARRERAVAGMLSGSKAEEAAEKNGQAEKDAETAGQDQKGLPLEEQVAMLKKELDEAKKQLEIRSSRKTRVKNVRINLLMYKDTAAALKEKCRKQKMSVNDLMNQLAERWVNGDI